MTKTENKGMIRIKVKNLVAYLTSTSYPEVDGFDPWGWQAEICFVGVDKCYQQQINMPLA